MQRGWTSSEHQSVDDSFGEAVLPKPYYFHMRIVTAKYAIHRAKKWEFNASLQMNKNSEDSPVL